MITPWYDSTPACWLLLLFMAVLMIFAVSGITVALTEPDYGSYVWVPIVLLLLCLFVCGSVVRRLLHRYYDRYAPDKEI